MIASQSCRPISAPTASGTRGLVRGVFSVPLMRAVWGSGTGLTRGFRESERACDQGPVPAADLGRNRITGVLV
ncbi:hypothetical protein GCM10017778_21010 [Streptomyces vinaceus]|nr:hypothetical protein GCM10017778_21010 [Streptomyces vinaceus]